MQGIETVKQALLFGASLLKDSGIEKPMMESRILLTNILGLSKEEILLKENTAISVDVLEAFIKCIKRRTENEPSSYITQIKEFFGIDFYVNKHVLIPRPDSETLIEAISSLFDKETSIHILDLGTGSGCLLLTLLTLYKWASGEGVDASEEAIKVAQTNAKRLNLLEKVSFHNASWNDIIFKNKFDLIISNPPYIRHEDIQSLSSDVRDYEPLTALDGGPDGLDCYREIAVIISKYLKKDGFAVIECGAGQHDDITEIFKLNQLTLKSQHKDFGGIVRALVYR